MDNKAIRMKNFNSLLLVIFSVIYIIVLGYLDYITGPYITFSFFYIIPMVVFAWFLPRELILIPLVLTILSRYNAVVRSPYKYMHPIFPIWNAFWEVAAFILIIYILVTLKEKLGVIATLKNKELLEVNAQETVRRIEEHIRELVNEHKPSKVLIGLSGGIDSAVLTTLAVRALGKDKVVVYHLYDDNCQKKYLEKARLMADWLGLQLHIQYFDLKTAKKRIRSSFFEWLNKLPPSLDRFFLRIYSLIFGETLFVTTMRREEFRKNWLRRLAYRYLVAEIEIMFDGWFRKMRDFLEEIAKKENMLILGAGNYTEASVGWFTKGGIDDMPYSPIEKLYKTQVNQIAKYLGIPARIRYQMPSAGVLSGASDEVALGMSYDKIDIILYGIEQGLDGREIADYGVTKREIKKGYEMNRLAIRKKNSPYQK